MENIIVIDDIFSDKDHTKIKKYLLSLKFKNNSFNDPRNTGDNPFWRYELSDNSFFKDYLTKKIEQYFKKQYKVSRLYLVGYTYGQNGVYHPDSTEKNNYTFCYYINIDDNMMFNEDTGGYFYIKIPNKKYILGIEPLDNRGVLFPSDYYHKGTSYNRFNEELRICIAWKLELI